MFGVFFKNKVLSVLDGSSESERTMIFGYGGCSRLGGGAEAGSVVDDKKLSKLFRRKKIWSKGRREVSVFLRGWFAPPLFKIYKKKKLKRKKAGCSGVNGGIRPKIKKLKLKKRVKSALSNYLNLEIFHYCWRK